MAMTKLLVVYGNSSTEENYEEMNLWYSWVHIRDVLTAKAAFACQRFELSKYQPRMPTLQERFSAAMRSTIRITASAGM